MLAEKIRMRRKNLGISQKNWLNYVESPNHR